MASFYPAAEDIVHEAMIRKCGGNVKSWRWRVMVLTVHGMLYYFRKRTDREPKGLIALIDIMEVKQKPLARVPHAFVLRHVSGREYLMHGETREQSNQWSELIAQAMHVVHAAATEDKGHSTADDLDPSAATVAQRQRGASPRQAQPPAGSPIATSMLFTASGMESESMSPSPRRRKGRRGKTHRSTLAASMLSPEAAEGLKALRSPSPRHNSPRLGLGAPSPRITSDPSHERSPRASPLPGTGVHIDGDDGPASGSTMGAPAPSMEPLATTGTTTMGAADPPSRIQGIVGGYVAKDRYVALRDTLPCFRSRPDALAFWTVWAQRIPNERDPLSEDALVLGFSDSINGKHCTWTMASSQQVCIAAMVNFFVVCSCDPSVLTFLNECGQKLRPARLSMWIEHDDASSCNAGWTFDSPAMAIDPVMLALGVITPCLWLQCWAQRHGISFVQQCGSDVAADPPHLVRLTFGFTEADAADTNLVALMADAIASAPNHSSVAGGTATDSSMQQLWPRPVVTFLSQWTQHCDRCHPQPSAMRREDGPASCGALLDFPCVVFFDVSPSGSLARFGVVLQVYRDTDIGEPTTATTTTTATSTMKRLEEKAVLASGALRTALQSLDVRDPQVQAKVGLAQRLGPTFIGLQFGYTMPGYGFGRWPEGYELSVQHWLVA